MRAPRFWRSDSLGARAASTALLPAALLYDAGQRLRAAAARPARIGAPVVCVGNATLGGSGKTPFALLLHSLLKERGVDAHFLSRGYGGSFAGPVRVDRQHTADEVGDEALLLAAAAPTWVAKDRAAGARAAAAAGAEAILMDDGFQNPTLRKDFSILLIDAADPIGNGRIFPAGPLREPLARALRRADAAVIVGDRPLALDFGIVFRASTTIEPTIPPQQVVAFCGIARAERFFESLARAGFTLLQRVAFGDHHRFRARDLNDLRDSARGAGAKLITTEKDFVRLPAQARTDVAVARLKMAVDDPERLGSLIPREIGRSI